MKHRLLLLGSLPLLFQPSISAQEKILWQDPGRVELADLTFAAGGPSKAPELPFTFDREDAAGTSPKIYVRDGKGIKWRLKGGLEVRAETFATRFVSALGYFAETTYFYPSGRIQGVKELKRASGFIKADGSFTYGAFERLEPNMRYLADQHWTWNSNPFAGTHELNGLKILVMLLSNWDNKDGRDLARGSNTGVLETTAPGARRWVYFVNDWGKSMGSWGRLPYYGRTQWSCGEFTAQTGQFARAQAESRISFGYSGQHTSDFREGITADDVRWLLRYLSKITDAQLRAGLMASGATAEEERCFAAALRRRIEQLQKASGPGLQREARASASSAR